VATGVCSNGEAGGPVCRSFLGRNEWEFDTLVWSGMRGHCWEVCYNRLANSKWYSQPWKATRKKAGDNHRYKVFSAGLTNHPDRHPVSFCGFIIKHGASFGVEGLRNEVLISPSRIFNLVGTEMSEQGRRVGRDLWNSQKELRWTENYRVIVIF